MTQPPYQPGPYGQPSQDPWAQQSGGGYGQYGQPRPQGQPQQQPQYGGQWGTDQTQQFGQGQQQYGQTPQYGQTQQFGSPYGQYGGGFPPEPPKNKTGKVVAIVVIAVLLLGGAGVGIFLATKDDGDKTAGGSTTSATASDTSDTSSSEEDETTTEDEETTTEDEEGGQAIDAQPGDCIKVNVASENNADVETIDCSSEDAIYRVGTREEDSAATCPNEQYVQYTEDGRLLLCLQLNVTDGECLEVDDQVDKRADCSGPTATHRVVNVFDGVDDETRCGDEATEVITYPQPPLTICLVSPAS